MFRFPSISPFLFQIHHPFLSPTPRFISTTLNSNAHSLTRSYLINTCGFSPQRAASLSKLIKIKSPQKPDSVIHFFTNLGLSQTQLLRVFETVPKYLLSDPHKTLNPKIEFLKSKGFSNSDIPRLIYKCPSILNRNLERQIIPCFHFFDTIFLSKDKLLKVILSYPRILCDLGTCSAPNIEFLREEGVPESVILKFIEYCPSTLKLGHKHFKDKVEELKELGFNPSTLIFVIALHVKSFTSKSTWARKEDAYRRWGWNEDDILTAFRLHPHCMSISRAKIEAIMDFVVNKLGFESSAIVRCPSVMSYSLRKRIIPRSSVILALSSKGLVKQLNLSTIFKSVEKVFLEKFIYCHEKKEADELLKLYQAKLARAK